MVDERALAVTLQSAHSTLQRGDAAAAARLLAPLLGQFPDRADVLHLHGLVLRGQGDLAGGRSALERAAEASGGSAEIRNTLGNLLADMGALDEAEAQFAQANAAQPGYLAAWINRGRLASMRGRHDEAIEWLEQACAIDPRSTLAYVTLGNALRRAGRADQAVLALERAVAIDPAKPSARTNLGIALREADRPADAVSQYDAAERAGYRGPELLENRAAAWLDLGEPARAREDIDRLVGEFPTYMKGHQARARLYWEWGLEGDPFGSYRRLADAHPKEEAVWLAWLQQLLAFRQYEGLLEAAEKAKRALGDVPWIAGMDAIALSETGRLGEAALAFEACGAAASGQPDLLTAFARHLLKSRDPARAAAMAEAGLRAAPRSSILWGYLGTAWRMLDDPREHWLNDYDRDVAQIEASPPGWAGSAEAFAEHAAPVLRALHLAKVHPAEQSLRNGTQSMGALFDRREPEIAQIRQAVVAACEAFIFGLPDDPAHPFLGRKAPTVSFTGSWSVRLTQHGFHINHIHEAGWLSSAYYFALPPSAPDEPEAAGWLQLGAPPDELGLGLPPRRLVEPRVGTLVLFPSSMWHGTVPFSAPGERLTAAFDIVPAG